MAERIEGSSDFRASREGREPLEYSIYRLLKKYQITVTTAESATGGMIASTLINVPRMSEFFQEGYVTYSDAAKVKMIHVSKETIDTYGVVSAQTAAPSSVGKSAPASVHRALRVSRAMVISVVEQGQCISEKRMALSAVSHVQPFSRSSAPSACISSALANAPPEA